MTYIFGILAGISLVLALHPYLGYPLSLVALCRLRRNVGLPRALLKVLPECGAGAALGKIAILLCVHNEEKVIEERITNLLQVAARTPKVAILVYSDGSTDRTVDILRKYAHWIALTVSEERHGKTYGMNQLASRTNADLLVFTDAAVAIPPEAIANLRAHFDDPTVGCVSGRIIATVDEDRAETSSTAEVSLRYWAFDAFVRRLESRLISAIGAHGPLFSIRRFLHEPVPPDLIDDFYVSMSVIHKGYRVVQADDFSGFKNVAADRGDEYTRKIRIACQSFNVHRALSPQLRRQTLLLRYLYFGHKLSRWFSVYFFAGAALFGSLALWWHGMHVLVITSWAALGAMIALGLTGMKPFDRLLDVIASLLANGIGIVQSLRGATYRTWASAKSARFAP